mmetsp:Transcript_10115/g.35374  ORF Transcript_10115/g.35374 Transcript_10115/m.35374 type:complete len:210 (+) Transcript_10115:1121-1750(+)
MDRRLRVAAVRKLQAASSAPGRQTWPRANPQTADQRVERSVPNLLAMILQLRWRQLVRPDEPHMLSPQGKPCGCRRKGRCRRRPGLAVGSGRRMLRSWFFRFWTGWLSERCRPTALVPWRWCPRAARAEHLGASATARPHRRLAWRRLAIVPRTRLRPAASSLPHRESGTRCTAAGSLRSPEEQADGADQLCRSRRPRRLPAARSPEAG